MNKYICIKDTNIYETVWDTKRNDSDYISYIEEVVGDIPKNTVWKLIECKKFLVVIESTSVDREFVYRVHIPIVDFINNFRKVEESKKDYKTKEEVATDEIVNGVVKIFSLRNLEEEVYKYSVIMDIDGEEIIMKGDKVIVGTISKTLIDEEIHLLKLLGVDVTSKREIEAFINTVDKDIRLTKESTALTKDEVAREIAKLDIILDSCYDILRVEF